MVKNNSLGIRIRFALTISHATRRFLSNSARAARQFAEPSGPFGQRPILAVKFAAARAKRKTPTVARICFLNQNLPRFPYVMTILQLWSSIRGPGACAIHFKHLGQDVFMPIAQPPFNTGVLRTQVVKFVFHNARMNLKFF